MEDYGGLVATGFMLASVDARKFNAIGIAVLGPKRTAAPYSLIAAFAYRCPEFRLSASVP